MDLSAKVAIVTGGGQGIGAAIAKKFLRAGASVVIADWDDVAGQEAESIMRDLGPVLFVKTNVADEKQVQRMTRETMDRFGHVDVLVNNAAISNPENGLIEELTLDQWNKVLAVNLTGPFLCSKHAVPYLKTSKGGIVNIASTRALMSEPHTEVYSTTKGGLLALTHSLANSLGPAVRVNCISPGWVETQAWQKTSQRQEPELSYEDHHQHPVGRVGEPEDIANLALFLASDQAGFVTGANFVVDGGMTRKMIYC